MTLRDMEFRVVGDVHGKFRPYKKIIKGVSKSIQVGDMGVGFYKYGADREVYPDQNPPYDSMAKGNHRFIRGNHDNPRVCAAHDFWIPDGTAEDGIFYVGGASSIDKEYRTEGMDWWPDEELSYEKLQEVIDHYAEVKPEIVISHECPDRIASDYLTWVNRVKIQDGSRTRQALDRMYEIHQPRLHIFGHWHHTFTMRLKGPERFTTFQCLDELDYCDVRIRDGDVSYSMRSGEVIEA